jgi:hypothetical protein
MPLAALLIAALLGGCGSYSKADFVARADAICTSATRQERSLGPPNFSGTATVRTRSLAAYLDREAAIVTSEAKQIARLQRPSGRRRSRAALNAYLRALATAAADFRRLAAVAGSPPRPAVARRVSAAEATLATDPVATLAAAYGMLACAGPGATIR